jgi:hypothetical protein
MVIAVPWLRRTVTGLLTAEVGIQSPIFHVGSVVNEVTKFFKSFWEKKKRYLQLPNENGAAASSEKSVRLSFVTSPEETLSTDIRRYPYSCLLY